MDVTSEVKIDKLSTESYKGTRDFYPEDQLVQNYIFSTMRKVVESFGYVEYGASILEGTEIYRAKSGSEIVNEQTYSFTDRGGRDVTIRPEMTPTVARMVAKKRQELAFPLRWYSIPNLFRYERPQRGRLREHWQLNCDIFGLDSLEADAEIITVAYDIMKAFGAKTDQFEIRVNNRRSLAKLLTTMDVPADQEKAFRSLLDKRNKIDDFDKQAEVILGQPFNHFDYIAHRDDEVGDLIDMLFNKYGIPVRNDPYLVRGFDYYTGTVFEVFDTSPENNRSLFGGGRYDDLVSIFGVEPVSGVGFGMGDVTMRDFLETHKLMPKLGSTTKVYICRLDESVVEFTEELAQYLRKNNINIAVDYTGRKVGAQIKTAEKQGVPYIICVGEEEAKTRKFKLKNLEKREEVEMSWEKLVMVLK